jgi:predicted MFS family arabinose efflux permease
LSPEPGHGALQDVRSVFLAFALAYFLSAMLRGVTATLAPVLSQQLGLSASDLGFLAGSYFLGFAALQWPMGAALDRHDARKVLGWLMLLAVVGCLVFAMSGNLWQLVLSRLLIGMGVAACLMAPLTHFRLQLSATAQYRANSWMLMTGSLGMMASTLPVHWAIPWIGWRGLFLLLAAALLISTLLIFCLVPASRAPSHGQRLAPARSSDGYAAVLRNPMFVRCLPLGVVVHGGLIAVQALWAGPWLTRVAGYSPAAAAQGLFLINACVLAAFLVWGFLMPRISVRGWTPVRLVAWTVPVALVILMAIIFRQVPAGPAWWASWCVCCTAVSLLQPAVGQALPRELAGRALSAFNLAIFLGVFLVQWGMGLLVDFALAFGMSEAGALRAAFAVLCGAGWWAWAWFISRAHLQTGSQRRIAANPFNNRP